MLLITLASWEKHPQVIMRRFLYWYFTINSIILFFILIYIPDIFINAALLSLVFFAFVLIAYRFSITISKQHKKIYYFSQNNIEIIGRSYKAIPILQNFLLNRPFNDKKDSEDKWHDKFPIKGKITQRQLKHDPFLPWWIIPFNLNWQQELLTITIEDHHLQSPQQIIIENIRKEDWIANEKDILNLLEK